MATKNAPGAPMTAPESPDKLQHVLRFWACFGICLVILGAISGLMLTVFFLMMGYHVF